MAVQTYIGGWDYAEGREFWLTCYTSNKSDTECTCNIHVDVTDGYSWFDSHLKIDSYDVDNNKWYNKYDQYSTAQPEAYAAWFCKPGTSNDWTETWTRTKVTRNIRVYITGYARVYSDKSSYVSLTIPPMSSYTVAYNANGGSGAPASQTKWYNESLTLSSTVPTRTGYSFLGWATSSTGSVAYASGASYTANAAVTLYAVWQLNKWAVTYNANGGSGAPATQYKEYGKTLTLDTKVPTWTGHTFLGWARSTSGSVEYQPGASYTTDATLNLYAKWQTITYAVTYNKNTTDNVSNMPSNGTKTYGQTYTILPQSGVTLPTRTGYSFQGWATTQGGSVVYQAGASYTTNAALNLYAVWQANTYPVSYDKGDTTDAVTGLPSNQTKTYGVALPLSTAKPARTGYNFTGWNTAKNGSGTAYASGASYTENAAVTLYAQWSIITYTVTYNGNGSTSGTTASQSKNYGASVNIRANGFSRTGYTFSTSGWNTKADGTGTSYAVNQSYSTNANLALYAQWSIITYQVTYNANGGDSASVPGNQTKSYGITLSLSSTVPTRTGYSFLGWATSSDGSVVYSPGAAYTGNAALNLYAVWQPQVSSISSAANVTLGNPCSVKWAPKVSTNKYRLKFTISNFDSGYLPSSSTFITGDYSTNPYTGYSIPINGVAQKITTATTGTMTVTLYTYDSAGTLLGSNSKTFTVTVPTSCKPTVSPSISQTSSSSVVDGWGIYVAGYSRVICQASATANYGATITSVKVTGDHNATGTTSLDSTSGVMTAGTKTFTFTATDSRGMASDPVSLPATVVAYAAPELTSFQATRQTADATKVNALATWTYKDIGNNAATATLQYKQTSASSWTPYSGTITSGTATTLSEVVFADDHSYNIKITVTDSLGNSATREVYIPTIALWEHMPAGGNGVAFGKAHEVSGHFESGWPLDVTGNITSTGNVSAAGNVYATGNVTAGGAITATGQVTGTQFNGNWNKLDSTNITSTDANAVTKNTIGYGSSNMPATSIGSNSTDGALYTQYYNGSWRNQIAQDYRNGNLFTRSMNNGTWTPWVKVSNTFYGTCDTAAATAAKVVTCANFHSTQLKAGVLVWVKFTNTNTADSATLNVNSSGAKSIYRWGTTALGKAVPESWAAGTVAGFIYDGSAWMLISFNYNTWPSAMSQDEANAGTATSQRSITAQVLNDTIRNKSQEAYLKWGGRNIVADFSPVDAALVPDLGANRFMFAKAAGITVEYSNDAGSTWTDYGLTDTQKVGLFSTGTNCYLGKHSSAGTGTVNDQLRVTIDTSAAEIYTNLNKVVIYASQISANNNKCQVKMEKALQSSPTSFSTHVDWTSISGWSAFNVLNFSTITLYGNASAASSQYGKIRFTFKQTDPNPSYGAATIIRIMGFGGVGWTTPSNMARNGHLYTFDAAQNATFPANVYGTSMTQTLATAGTDTTGRLISAKVLNDTIAGKAASTTHTHTTSIATSTGTNQITLAANTKYAITAGGTSYVFTTPPDSNTDTKVTITAVNPASETSYYPLMYTATSGTVGVNAHANDSNKIRKGTTSQEGWTIHQLGNNKNYDTDGNSKGYIRLYGSGTGYGQITYTNSTANTTHVLPANADMAGTILEVVEEGTWNNGKYIKYSNGMAECYGWTSLTSAISSTYGTSGICYKDTSVSFPSTLFKSGTSPSVNITMQRNGGLLWPSIHGLSNTAVSFYIGSATAESSTTIYIHVHAKGVWK